MEVVRGGVEEDQFEAGEQIAAAGEQILFHGVLDATRCVLVLALVPTLVRARVRAVPGAVRAAVLRAVNGRVASRVGVVLVLLPGVLLLWLHRRTEPGHGAVQVLQFELGGAGEGLVSSPLQGCCISLCFDKILQIIPMQGRGILWISSLLQERVTVASLTETYGSTGPLPGLNSLLQ